MVKIITYLDAGVLKGEDQEDHQRIDQRIVRLRSLQVKRMSD